MSFKETFPPDFDPKMKDDPRVFWLKIRTTFNNGDIIEQDEIGTSLHIFYDAVKKKGVKMKEYLEFVIYNPHD